MASSLYLIKPVSNKSKFKARVKKFVADRKKLKKPPDLLPTDCDGHDINSRRAFKSCRDTLELVALQTFLLVAKNAKMHSKLINILSIGSGSIFRFISAE